MKSILLLVVLCCVAITLALKEFPEHMQPPSFTVEQQTERLRDLIYQLYKEDPHGNHFIRLPLTEFPSEVAIETVASELRYRGMSMESAFYPARHSDCGGPGISCLVHVEPCHERVEKCYSVQFTRE